MLKIRNYTLIMFMLAISSISKTFAGQNTVDSLKFALKNAKHDTLKCSILNAMIEAENDAAVWSAYNDQLKNIAEQNLKSISDGHSLLRNTFLKHLASAVNNTGYLFYQKGEIIKALEQFEKSLEIYREIGDKGALAESLNNIGVIYYQQGNISKALEYYIKSLKTQEELGNKTRIATCCNNIGSIYQFKGDVPKALEYFSRGLKISEDVGDKNVIAPALNNIAIIYQKQGHNSKALEYNYRALKIYEEAGNKNGMALAFNNIGLIYNKQGNTAKALEYYRKSLKIQEETGDKAGLALSLNNIGRIYHQNGDIKNALEHYAKSLKIQEEMNDRKGITTSLNNIGIIHLQKKDYPGAIALAQKSLQISREIGFTESIKDAAELLSKIYTYTGDYKQALENYELHVLMRDSIANEETRKVSIKNQLQYEYEKKAAADSVKNAEAQKVKDAQLMAQRAQIKQEKFQRYGLLSGLAVVLLGLGFVINRFRVTQKQKKIIESQKLMVDNAFETLAEKNKEVLDSIHYAKRIQTALVTSEKYIDKSLSRLKNE